MCLHANTVQLDQAVVYIERLPDTVQNDHFDWGFRLSSIYGVRSRFRVLAPQRSRPLRRFGDGWLDTNLMSWVLPVRPHDACHARAFLLALINFGRHS
jgi:hypothetical protein